MDQILAELEHKRRISAMGPGGLTRERASFWCAMCIILTMVAFNPVETEGQISVLSGIWQHTQN
jgi:hypothetical protein